MDHERPQLELLSSEGDDLGPLGELERRVLGLVEQLREARTQRVRTELEVERLREELRDRDTQIIVLRDELRSDSTRDAVKRRVEALLQKVAELEREG